MVVRPRRAGTLTRIAWALALAIPALVWAFAATGTAAGPGQAEWTGRVVAGTTLDPVVGARVAFETDADAAVTDDDGRFRLDVGTGARLLLSAPGFFDGFVELTDADPDLGTLVLREELSLRGRLVQGRDPVAGALVFAEGIDDLPSPTAVSDADGNFRIGGIDPERLNRLLVVWGEVVEAIDLGYASTPLEPRPYDLGEIALPTPVRVQGRVVSNAGVPVSDAIVWLVSDDRTFWPLQRVWQLDAAAAPPLFVRSAGDGSFSIAALPGRYKVRAAADRPPLQRIIDVHATTDVGTLVLPEPASTGGLVLDARGDPLAGARIRVEWVTDAISMPLHSMAFAEVTSGPDGCYRLPVVVPGETGLIQVSRPGYAAARVRLARATSPPSSTDCNDLEPIRLADVGALRGLVRDENGAPLPGATVEATRLQTASRPWGRPRQSAESDGNGEFVLQDLEVGDYELRASAPGHRGMTMNGPAVRASAIEVVELALDSPGPKHLLRIQLLDHRGVPVPDAEVGLSRDQADRDDQPLPVLHTGADGRVRFDGVAGGAYHIDVSSRVAGLRYGNPVRLDEALPEVVLHAPVPTTPVAPLRGRIVDAAGEGVPGVVVTFEDLVTRIRSLRTFSERDGSFRLQTVPAGEYGVSAERRGIAPILLENPLAHPVSGTDDLLLEVPLSSTISGRIVGLTADDLIGTTLRARREILIGEGGINASVVGHVHLDGTFTIDDLSPGEWSIRARALNGLSVETTVVIDRPGTSLDTTITMAEGLVLSGVVTYRDRPVAGRLDLAGMNTGESRSLQLGPDGSFVARGLPPGRYRAWVRGTPVELFTEQIDLRGDQHVEIRVRGAAVSGAAVDADTGQPVVGAHLRANPDPKWVWDAHRESHRTGADGTFAVGPFGAGPWLFEFSAPGYAKERLRLDLGDEDLANVRVPMRPTPGLNLRVVTPPGPLPGGLGFIWRDDTTGEIYRPSAFPRSRGSLEVHLPDIALGPGLLTVATQRPRYAARLAIDNDGSPVDVVLEPAGGMCLTVPELMESTVEATLRLSDREGRPVQEMHGPDVWEISRSREFCELALPPGIYEAVVEAADGRVWRGPIEIVAGKTNRVELR